MSNFVNFWQSYLPPTCPYFCFQTITWVNISRFLPNLVWALILWRSGLELLLGKCGQFLTELYACDTWYFCFRTIIRVSLNTFSPNLICALILWFGITVGYISSIFDKIVIPPWHDKGRVLSFHIFIPRLTIVAGIMVSLWMFVCPSIRLSVSHTPIRPSVYPSVFHFQMITWININGFSPNLVCALILWRSGLGLLVDKFCKILTELSAQDMPIFLFPEDNLCKCQGILAKLGTCIDIKEICFGIANWQISSMFDRVISPRHDNGGVI